MKNLRSKGKAVNGTKAKAGGYAESVMESPKQSKIKNGAVYKEKPITETADSFNSRQLLKVLMEVKNGNFGVRMPIDEVGLNGKICDTLNDIISLNERMMLEFKKQETSLVNKEN